ncbi:MAG: hypothetical protein ACI9KN_002559, partial [Gammaproteobacteria bacterium]
MQFIIRPVSKLLYWLLILVALVIGVLRLGFANIDYFKADIEDLLRQSVLPGLRFSDIELEWTQLNHIIYVRDASLRLPNQKKSIIVEKLSFEVSLRKSLLSQSLVFQEVNAQVDTLNIRKDKNHQWWL